MPFAFANEESPGMASPRVDKVALIFALGVAASVGMGRTADLKVDAVVRVGRVLELTEALKTAGLVSDPGPIATQVVLREEDGTVIPLLSDEGSRAFFLDERLRRRPVRIQARRYPGIPYLQVVSFDVEEDGRWRTPEYFCDVCTISVRYPQICPCCQGEMVLRMKPGSD
jgi:hypothetical protein